jgi:hypothetical protein
MESRTPLTFVQQAALIEKRALYPNPFGPLLNVYFRLRVDADVTLAVYDVAGEVVCKVPFQGHAGDNVLQWAGVNASGLRCASGVYTLRVSAVGVDGSIGGYWDRAAAMR